MRRIYSALVGWVVDHPKTVLVVYAILAAIATVGTIRIKEEEDLMVFLPTHDPDVRLFKEVSGQFGALRVALVGVEVPVGKDVFQPEVLKRLQSVTSDIRNVRGVDRVLSLSSLTDVVPGEMGAEILPLVGDPPETAEASAALRKKVMSRDHIVGTFVSEDARATLLMVFLADGGGDKEVVAAVRRIAGKQLADYTVYYGGAPFAGRAIYEEAQSDVWRLSPFALILLLVVVVLAYRDPVGVLLTIASVAFSTAVVIGGQGLWGEHFTVATSTLPVILFASGNSYAVHVLGRYYMLRSAKSGKAAIKEALDIVGPPLLVAAGTTAAGFFAFLATDVRPMRAFGIACGAGVLICWLTSLTLVPAVISLWPRPSQPSTELNRFGDWLVKIWRASERHSRPLLVVGLAVSGLLIQPMLKVKVRMEPRAFFRPGSEPWLADRFLDERFGGGTFLQIALHGDFDHPNTLREVARLEDFLATLPNVTQVTAITSPLRLVGEAMGGGRRLPMTSKQAANLYFFLEGEAGMRALIADGRRDILVQVRVRGDGRSAVLAVEEYMKKQLRAAPARPTAADVGERLAWIAATAGQKLDGGKLAAQVATLAPPPPEDAEWGQKRLAMATEFVASDEAPPADEAQRQAVIKAAAEGRDALDKAYASVAKDPQEGKDAARRLWSRLEDERRRMGTQRAVPVMMQTLGLGGNKKVEERVRLALDDVFAAIEDGAARLPLSAKVAGQPILDRGFSRSVGQNTERSLLVAIGVVLLLLVLLFRSLKLSLICMAPSVVTLIVILGVMGYLGVDIDLGTSLVAGIATGAGADFAMHYLWYLRSDHPDEVSRTVGPVMVLSILLVAMGFAILAVGKSPVMHLFGILAALSMALSALLTCLFLPALLYRFAPNFGARK